MKNMKIVKDSIMDQVYRIIKDKILLTELRLGEQINPREMAGEFRVSVMPVRDALWRLVNEGLVVNKSRVGFFVRSFTREEIAEIMEVRKLYELYCLENYFDKIDRKLLAAYLDRCGNNAELTRLAFDELDNDIHDLLIHASQNRYLEKSYHAVKNQIIIFRHLNKDRIEVANQEHMALLRAILDGDKAAAVKVLEEHIERVASAIL